MTDQGMYGGKVVMVYDPIQHLYAANGIIVPSVTGIVGVIDKPALIPWAVNETVKYLKDRWLPDTNYTKEQISTILQDAKESRFRISQKALNIGSDAHDWIERHIKAKILQIPEPDMPEYPPVLAAVTSFLEWESTQDIQYVASERRLFSRRFMYSGTVDILMRVKGELVVGDLKTSKAIYPEYFLQCAAYAHAITEEDAEDVNKVAIIRIPKDGKAVEVQSHEDISRYFNVFLACLSIWRWKNNWSPESEQWQV